MTLQTLYQIKIAQANAETEAERVLCETFLNMFSVTQYYDKIGESHE